MSTISKSKTVDSLLEHKLAENKDNKVILSKESNLAYTSREEFFLLSKLSNKARMVFGCKASAFTLAAAFLNATLDGKVSPFRLLLVVPLTIRTFPSE